VTLKFLFRLQKSDVVIVRRFSPDRSAHLRVSSAAEQTAA